MTGTTPIVAGSGTGAYRGISGTFTMTVTIDEIVAKSKCNPSGEFLAQAIVMTGSGTVSLRSASAAEPVRTGPRPTHSQ